MPGLSYHDIVMTDNKILCTRQKPIKRTIYLWKNVDIVNMKIDTNTLSSNILKHKHDLQKYIENIWNQLKQGIDNIINKNLPSKQSSATVTNPWANTTIKKLSRRKKKAYNKARRSNSEQDWEKYKRLQSLSQKPTRQAHNKYLYDIISAKLKDNNKQFYSYMKSKKQDASGISSLRDNQGYLHSEAKDKAEILSAQFKTVYTQEDHTNIPHKGPSPYSAMQHITITDNGVYKLLRNIKSHKATGPDNIQARYLKKLALELTPAITFLFQTSLEQGKLPNDWLQAHLVPVFKKGDKNTASNYRRVSLTSILC